MHTLFTRLTALTPLQVCQGLVYGLIVPLVVYGRLVELGAL